MLLAWSDETKGIIFLVVFLFLCITAFYAGYWLRGKSAVPPRVIERMDSAFRSTVDRKDSYKRLAERYSARITSAGALVHALRIKAPSEDLDKVDAALKGFDSLIAHGDELNQLTPEREIDISHLLAPPKKGGEANA